MKMIYKKIAFSILLSAVLASCGPKKDLVYFSDLQNNSNYSTAISNSIAPKVQPDDILDITVNSLNAESNIMFNGGAIIQNTAQTQTNNTTPIKNGYLVDKEGSINFPVIGKIKLAGLTKDEATTKMTAEITKYVKQPIVNIRFLNFKVTVIGEVTKPSTFTIPSERINVLEALGMAGDMTVYGKRNNVLIIREDNNKRVLTRLDLNNKDVLNSPFFYLQQNDIVYVEPEKVKATQAFSNTRFTTVLIAATSLITVIISRFYR